MNPISQGKLDYLAFLQFMFQSHCIDGEMERVERESGRRKEGKGKTNPCRGEQRETAAALPQADRNQ